MINFCVLTGKKNLRKFFGRLVKSVLAMSTTKLWAKLNFLKSFFLSGSLNKFFMLYGKRNSAMLLKFRFTSPEDSFSRSKNLKLHKCWVFAYLQQKKCLRKRFGRLVKSVLVLSTVTFWGRLFFWRFFFCNIENKFYASWQKKLSEVVKTSFYESRRSIFSLEKLENAQMCSFLVLTAKRILRKLLAELSKVNLYCPE